MKIVLDSGHGINTPGKRTPNGSMKEFEFNSAVANYTKDILANYQCEVAFTHDPTGKVDIPLDKRTDYANRWGADVFVSIHANASGSDWSNAEGIETYVYTSKPKEAVELAHKIHSRLIVTTGRKDRGIKTADFHVLRETHMTSILCECGFMTSHEESTLLKSTDYRLKCATAIAEGLIEQYGLKPKPQPKDPLNKLYRVQVGAFSQRENAERLAKELEEKGYKTIIAE